MDFLSRLFDTSGFPPRWTCGNWTTGHGWLHILSDLGVWSAYVAIPCVLIYFLLRRRDLPFRKIFLLFGAFILACGTTHLMEAIIFWWPAYRLAGVIKLLTAVVSWATVFALIPVVPRVLAMRSPEELEQEIEARKLAERELQRVNAELERRVEQRTIELTQAVGELRSERQALENREQQFRTLAESIPHLCWMAHPDGHIFWYNRRWYDYTGSTPEQMEGWGWQSLHDPAVLPGVLERWKKSITTGQPFDMVFPLRGADGVFREFLTRVEPIKNSEGRVVRWFGTNTDITERRQAEVALQEVNRQLRESEERFRNMADNAPVMIWVTDRKGVCVYLNKQWYGFTGTTAAHGLGVGWLEATHPDDRVRAETIFRSANDSHAAFRLEYRLRRHDGAYRWSIDTASPRFGPNGEFLGYIGSVVEIEERKMLENELRKLAADLSEANRRKDEFLATLAHELRNPLAPIRNGLQVIRLAHSDPGTVERARVMMDRQLRQMVRLVDDLLDVSRISLGKIELRRERVDLATVVNNAVETSRPLIESSGHELTISMPSEPIHVDADPTRLAQVFANLLNNAAKYNERGGHVWLNVQCFGNDVQVSVRDNGIGIPPHMLPKVFDMFTQVDRSLERSQGGLGIGLTLVKRLVEMQGGNVEAHSAGIGAGSEFVVRLPIVLLGPAQPDTASDMRESPDTRQRSRILIADDNEDSATSLAMMLELMGNEIRTSHDGLEAVESAADFRPDVILLDIGMPKLNGYEACRRIRKQPWSEKTVLIALTGWGQDDDRRRSHEAGFDHHLVKPVDPATLQKLLKELLQPGV